MMSAPDPHDEAAIRRFLMPTPHPLTERIIAVRRTLDALEAEPHKTRARRDDIVRQSKFLEGLEAAATLALPHDQIQILLNDMRRNKEET